MVQCEDRSWEVRDGNLWWLVDPGNRGFSSFPYFSFLITQTWNANVPEGSRTTDKFQKRIESVRKEVVEMPI